MRVTHIRSKLILASLIALIPFIAWNGTVQYLRYRESRDAAIAEQREVARSIAHACGDYCRDLAGMGRALGRLLIAMPKVPSDRMSSVLARIALDAPEISAMAVTDSHGLVTACSVPSLLGRDLSRVRSVRQIVKGRDSTVGDWSFLGVGTGTIGVTCAVRDSVGRLQGMAIMLAGSGDLQSTLPIPIMRGHDIVVTDQEGRAILTYGRASSMPAERWMKSGLIRDALKGRSSVTESFGTPHAGVMLGAAEPIPSTGWATAVFIAREEVVAPLNRMAAVRLSVILLATLLSIGLAIRLGNRMSGPLLLLVDAAHSIAHGDLAARANVRTRDEIEHLADSFNEMAVALDTRTSELNAAVLAERRQKQRASALYFIAQGIVVTINLADRLESIARSLASLCRVKRCVILLKRGGRLVAGAGWGLLHPETFDDFAIGLDETRGPSTASEWLSTPIYAPDMASQHLIDRAFAREQRLEGYLALPLVRRGHLVGLAILDTPGERPTFDEDTIDDARGMADLAAIAIENAETYEKQHNIAQSLQKSMLAPVPESVGAYHMASGYYAALEVSELGGDFYDYLQINDGRLGFVIADVSGKGLEAAMYTAMGKYTLRAFMSEEPDPGRVLTRANRVLTQSGGEWGFVTVFHGLLDPASSALVYSNAGHPPVLLVDPSGTVTRLPSDGRRPPLGVMVDTDYPAQECAISPGSMLVCYTDGVIEARQGPDQYGIERLEALVAQVRHLSPTEVVETIHAAVTEFSGGRVQDDIALLVIRRDPVWPDGTTGNTSVSPSLACVTHEFVKASPSTNGDSGSPL